MCGISGFVGVSDTEAKKSLVWHLGIGIDKRGGDACGYVASSVDKLHVGKKPGYWTLARKKFINRAASGRASMMHARFATCGKKVVSEAHPFAIKRNNRTALYGCHNGIVYTANESAKRNNRTIVVDSEEIFHLLADNDLDGIRKLEGYGVVTWIDPKDPMTINALRLSDNSDIYVVRLESGGIVYGSTKSIVNEALEQSKLSAQCYYELEIGRIYHFRDDGVYRSSITDVKFAERKWNYTRYTGGYSYWAGSGRGYGSEWPGFDFDDAVESEPDYKRHLRDMKQEEQDRKKIFGHSRILPDVTSDSMVEFEIEAMPDTVDQNDNDTVDNRDGLLYCESCGQDIDEEEADWVSWQFEEYFGRKDTPLICSSCLYDSGNAVLKAGA